MFNLLRTRSQHSRQFWRTKFILIRTSWIFNDFLLKSFSTCSIASSANSSFKTFYDSRGSQAPSPTAKINHHQTGGWPHEIVSKTFHSIQQPASVSSLIGAPRKIIASIKIKNRKSRSSVSSTNTQPRLICFPTRWVFISTHTMRQSSNSFSLILLCFFVLQLLTVPRWSECTVSGNYLRFKNASPTELASQRLSDSIIFRGHRSLVFLCLLFPMKSRTKSILIACISKFLARCLSVNWTFRASLNFSPPHKLQR